MKNFRPKIHVLIPGLINRFGGIPIIVSNIGINSARDPIVQTYTRPMTDELLDDMS